jgi:hypothetical protein
VEAILTDPARIERELARQSADDASSGMADLSASIEAQLADVAKQQANLTRAIAVLSDPEAMAPLTVELAGLAERDRAAQQRQQREALRERSATAQVWLRTVAARVRGMGFAERRLALDALGVTVTVYPPEQTPRYSSTANVLLPGAPMLVSNRALTGPGNRR